ncbi:MAG: tRNA threonylcarbamoyladenosine dehydratase [Oscillospiraceae bacterium]|nr:tRNA threonylcarbamoyladenosine dehydratase [Oscillospiraceae bacterium]MBR5722620.1 tRNA threonylcarbamoyladenosine dehydratase [Oscillospiraceae bacterium]
MQEQFSRTEQMLGADAMARLRGSRVAVFGIGGVGGYAVEALARTGIGTLDLIDSDTVCESNLNRQIIALHSTLGQNKVDAAAARIRDICPETTVNRHCCFFLPETAEQFDFSQYDYVIDAIDTVKGKLEIILRAKAAGVPVISCMGAGNKLDPTALRVADIYKTKVCPLARVMRYELRKRGVDALKVVYSEEPPAVGAPPEGNTGRRSTPGSVMFVPAAAGLILAGEVIRDLAGIPRG